MAHRLMPDVLISVPTLDGRLAAQLPRFRHVLEEQREFRRQQLAELRGQRATSLDDGRRSVTALVAASARRALTDIDAALARMDGGHYGRCVDCQAEIPLRLLEVIPQTARCLSCHREDAAE